jgi:hypothetical protein
MIDITTRTDKPKVAMTPRTGFRAKAKPQEFNLVYGHKCPYCGNVISACFETDKEIDLFPYEETAVLSQGEKNRGELLKTVPNQKDPKGCYRSEYFGKGSNGRQRLLMKNHIMRVAAIESRFLSNSGDHIWETGERPCMYAGIFSEREDLLVKDLLLLFKFSPSDLAGYNIPKVSQLIPDPQGDSESGQFRWVPAVGTAPPVILAQREYIVGGVNYFLVRMMKPFHKGNKEKP